MGKSLVQAQNGDDIFQSHFTMKKLFTYGFFEIASGTEFYGLSPGSPYFLKRLQTR